MTNSTKTNLPELALITDIMSFPYGINNGPTGEDKTRIISTSNISSIEKTKIISEDCIQISFINKEEPIYVTRELEEVLHMIKTDVYSIIGAHEKF